MCERAGALGIPVAEQIQTVRDPRQRSARNFAAEMRKILQIEGRLVAHSWTIGWCWTSVADVRSTKSPRAISGVAKEGRFASDQGNDHQGGRPSLLIISGDTSDQNRLVEKLADRYDVRCATGLEPVAQSLGDRRFACILVDSSAATADESMFLRRLRELAPDSSIVLVPSIDEAAHAVAAALAHVEARDRELAPTSEGSARPPALRQAPHRADTAGDSTLVPAPVDFEAIVSQSPSMLSVLAL